MPTRNPRKFKERSKTFGEPKAAAARPISIYGSDEARNQAVASLQALLQDKLVGKPSTDFEYIVVEGSEATLSTAKTNRKINPEKACEELNQVLESRKGMCVHVHIKLPRCNLNDEEIVGILEVLVTHGKARLSSLQAPGNDLTDGLCDWISREVEKSSGKMFSAVKEIDLSYNYLTAVGVGKLVKACPGLGHLDVRMNVVENKEAFWRNRAIFISPQRLDRKTAGDAAEREDVGPTDVASLLRSFRQITTSGDNSPESVSQELLKLQNSRSKLYRNGDAASKLGERLLAAFRKAGETGGDASGPYTAPPDSSGNSSESTRAPLGPPRFSPSDVAALAQSQLSRSRQARSDIGLPSRTGVLPRRNSLTHTPTESSRMIAEVQTLIARLEANDNRNTEQRKDNAALMRALVIQLTALQESMNRTSFRRGGDTCVGGSEQTVADLLDTLKKFLDTHKAESAATSGEEPAGQSETAEAYRSDAKEEQRMTVGEMEANLFNSLRKDDRSAQQNSTGNSTSVANRIINVPLRVIPRSEVTKYDRKPRIPEENPGRPSELVCGLDLQSTSRGYLVLYISPFPGQQHLQQGDTILAINGVGLVPRTNSDAKHIRNAFGRNLYNGVLCTILRTAEGKEQMKTFRSINVNRRLYIEGLLQATGVTWKELVNSGVASDPDVVVGEMAARRGCRGGLLRVSLENAAPMVSIHGDRESVEGVTEEVTELITVLAKRVRDEKTNKEAATQAAAEFKAAVLARANAGIHSAGVAKQEPTATEYESSPASSEDLRGDGAVSLDEMNSKKVGMEGDRKQTNRLGRNDDAADDSEGSAEFISAKESEAGSM